LVAGVSFQLEPLSTRILLGLEIDETVWAGWNIQVGGLGDNQFLWCICFDHYGINDRNKFYTRWSREPDKVYEVHSFSGVDVVI